MIEPRQIIEDSDSEFTIVWSDDAETKYNAADLRRKCPCASCVDEWTGKKILRDESVSDDLDFTRFSLAGKYGLNLHFSDGHNTGIFTFKYLREISEN